jgi:hypothetical protein
LDWLFFTNVTSTPKMKGPTKRRATDTQYSAAAIHASHSNDRYSARHVDTSACFLLANTFAACAGRSYLATSHKSSSSRGRLKPSVTRGEIQNNVRRENNEAVSSGDSGWRLATTFPAGLASRTEGEDRMEGLSASEGAFAVPAAAWAELGGAGGSEAVAAELVVELAGNRRRSIAR